MKDYTLGIDLGSSSIGWAIINDHPSPNETNVLAGVRVFPEGVDRDKGREKSKSETRRAARGMRRQHERKSRRKSTLKQALIQAGIFAECWGADPYALRRRGLDEPLTPGEFGRALFHLNQHRGFKSNRKSESKKETGVVYEGIEHIARDMEKDGARTLGEFLANRKATEKVRNHYFLRDMVKREFNLLWDSQSRFHADRLTPELRQKMEHIIFFQRPLRPANLGKCELEPDEERLARASWFAQRFRLLQDISNLRLLLPDGTEGPLSEEQRQALTQQLGAKRELKIEKVRSLLQLDERTQLNIESYRDKLQGNTVEVELRRLFKDYDKRKEFYIEQVYEACVEQEEEDFEQKARIELELNEEQIQSLYKIIANQPKGYLHLSRKAILKLLPHMQNGCDFFKAKENAGYLAPSDSGESLDILPLPDKSLPNPIVRKALFELRRVVNAIIREYGKPSRIIIELARDTKGSAKERNETMLRNFERDRERQRIEAYLKEQGIASPSRNDVLKYRLWKECADQRCPFTGRTIGFDALFRTGEVQVEHILPYSRSLDDSQFNKTLCFASENQWKNNRTPWEAYHANPAQWEEIQARVQRMHIPPNKKRKFLQHEINLDECVTRQLNDTRYMSREARAYLQRLYPQNSLDSVTTTRGVVTAELRRRWGLNSLLHEDEDEQRDRKNRKDHRHHAIDAAVIAMTTPSHLKNLARRSDFRQQGKPFPAPWATFRDEMQTVINRMLVSHRVTRRISGALHKDTAYGHRPGEKPQQFVYRKPLESLTPAMIGKIRDPLVQSVIRQRLEEFGGDIKKAFGNRDNPVLMPNKKGLRIPIHSVRISEIFTNMIPICDQSGKPYRYVEPDSNHHISIFEYKDKKGQFKRDAVITSMFEAAQIAMENGRRRKQGLPPREIIRKTHPEIPEARFLFSLSKNEMFLLDIGDETVLCRIQKFDVNGAIILRPHTYAGKCDNADMPPFVYRRSPSTLIGRKIVIDALGRMAEAHD